MYRSEVVDGAIHLIERHGEPELIYYVKRTSGVEIYNIRKAQAYGVCAGVDKYLVERIDRERYDWCMSSYYIESKEYKDNWLDIYNYCKLSEGFLDNIEYHLKYLYRKGLIYLSKELGGAYRRGLDVLDEYMGLGCLVSLGDDSLVKHVVRVPLVDRGCVTIAEKIRNYIRLYRYCSGRLDDVDDVIDNYRTQDIERYRRVVESYYLYGLTLGDLDTYELFNFGSM